MLCVTACPTLLLCPCFIIICTRPLFLLCSMYVSTPVFLLSASRAFREPLYAQIYLHLLACRWTTVKRRTKRSHKGVLCIKSQETLTIASSREVLWKLGKSLDRAFTRYEHHPIRGQQRRQGLLSRLSRTVGSSFFVKILFNLHLFPSNTAAKGVVRRIAP